MVIFHLDEFPVWESCGAFYGLIGAFLIAGTIFQVVLTIKKLYK